MTTPPPTIHTDLARFELTRICAFIEKSYWGQGRSRERLLNAFADSLCFGAFHGDRQVGFARVVGDRVFFAYIMDLFVFPEQRGQGIGKALMEAILAHPDCREVTSLMLSTRDSHGLYARYGFVAPGDPSRVMVGKLSGTK